MFEGVFDITCQGFGKYTLTGTTVTRRPWTQVYNGAFPSSFVFTKKELISRNSFYRFWDPNMDGFVVSNFISSSLNFLWLCMHLKLFWLLVQVLLEKDTIKIVVIHADSHFNICLNTYKTLKFLKKNEPHLSRYQIQNKVLTIIHFVASFLLPTRSWLFLAFSWWSADTRVSCYMWQVWVSLSPFYLLLEIRSGHNAH